VWKERSPRGAEKEWKRPARVCERGETSDTPPTHHPKFASPMAKKEEALPRNELFSAKARAKKICIIYYRRAHLHSRRGEKNSVCAACTAILINCKTRNKINSAQLHFLYISALSKQHKSTLNANESQNANTKNAVLTFPENQANTFFLLSPTHCTFGFEISLGFSH